MNKGNKFIDLQNQLKYATNYSTKNVILQITLDNKEFLSIAPYNDSNIVYSNGNKQSQNVMTFSCSDIKRKDILSIKTLKQMDAYKKLVESFNNNFLYYDKLDTYITLYNILNF